MSKTCDWEVNDDDVFCTECEVRISRSDEYFLNDDNEIICSYCYDENGTCFECGESLPKDEEDEYFSVSKDNGVRQICLRCFTTEEIERMDKEEL